MKTKLLVKLRKKANKTFAIGRETKHSYSVFMRNPLSGWTHLKFLPYLVREPLGLIYYSGYSWCKCPINLPYDKVPYPVALKVLNQVKRNYIVNVLLPPIAQRYYRKLRTK